MSDAIVELQEDVSKSALYSDDLAPVPKADRSWSKWNITAIWVGMAVNIPTYVLASYMIRDGLGWFEALAIIFLANIIVTIPMIFNGYAGVKYGIPFPVLGRSSFGTTGVHIPSLVRALVACGWFGVQIWIGGLAIYAIWGALTGSPFESGLTPGKFVGFGIFWVINIYFIIKGTDSIRKLEDFAAPILVGMGILLIGWGASNAGGFGEVLRQSKQLQTATVRYELSDDEGRTVTLHPLQGLDGATKASEFEITVDMADGKTSNMGWQVMDGVEVTVPLNGGVSASYGDRVSVRFRNSDGNLSSVITASVTTPGAAQPNRWSKYLFWLTAMVGFWATMSISISDITRYVGTQRDQIFGQMLGLPGTMLLYSFVGVFVTSAAMVYFGDVMIGEDAPWDPVSLIAKFDAPILVIVAQLFMLIATLSTNIAANVIAPANAFANAFPKAISFKGGGIITGAIGILLAPWWLLDEISSILVFVSGFLGPVLAIFLADYFVIAKQNLNLADLYKSDGRYSYSSGFNIAALWALAGGIAISLVGFWVPSLQWLYTLSWFTGFAVSFGIYVLLAKPVVDNA